MYYSRDPLKNGQSFPETFLNIKKSLKYLKDANGLKIRMILKILLIID